MKIQGFNRRTLLLLVILSSPNIARAAERTLDQLVSPTLLALLQSTSMESFAGHVPRVSALSSFEGSIDSCYEAERIGLVCRDDEAFYIDDLLLQDGKEWSLKPPKTGIGIIDNNRELIAGAVGGGLVGGPAGSLIGAFWGDKQQSQAKIDELRRQNMNLQANNAQAKIDRADDAERFKAERQNLVDSNGCLRANSSVYQVAVGALAGYLGEFNQCLLAIDPNDEQGSTKAQSCLDTYVGKANAGIHAAQLFGNCL